MKYEHVKQTDPEIFDLMEKELRRQQSHLELIASENFVSEAVMEAMGSHLTAVYFAMLKPGDTVLGMSLDHGGHLTHGSKVNLSGKYYNFISYGVNHETERIDYDQIADKIQEHRPKLVVVGASAYPRAIDFKLISQMCRDIGALMMVDMAHIAGLVAAGLHQNPVPYADFVTTTTHPQAFTRIPCPTPILSPPPPTRPSEDHDR